MAKVRVSFDVDLSKINPQSQHFDTEEAAIATLTEILFKPARMRAMAEMQEVRRSTLSNDEKAAKTAALLRLTMLTLAAEANMTAQELADSAVINVEHRVERLAA